MHSADFITETDAAAFMPAQIDDDAFAGRIDQPQCRFELIAAIATQRPHDVAGGAFGMQAHQATIMRGARDHRHMFHARGITIDMDREFTEAGGQRRLCDFLDWHDAFRKFQLGNMSSGSNKSTAKGMGAAMLKR